ncbi:hypothetical protein RO3G_03410 [Rhizopus delemar RA 99-880]|uniref:Holocytochrome c-type synthase n=1 Tax=Rhizopus delemar (strain RA 99-880 / ATCC MYA-4621 / FGSC 9543 / NRRL 43880) TaxID=246409 RepID=I1BR76_RHIO9|nr:hypothetical protein RO3G_03410 [Rhizopus delemar RA 99-880]|eukprot:EIE78706.1 hypothetical protein RO3G_03410 [Rhizopus delemar RA 99-880]
MAEESKCPVDHSSYKHFIPQNNTDTQEPSNDKVQGEAKCPVDHNSYKHFIPPQSQDSAKTDSCPVDHSTYKKSVSPPKEGCDSDAIDSTNYMPKVSEQAPQPGQRMSLGTQRETSTIPRANSSDKLWIYPSEQMFFNAMKRKNWTPNEEDMSVVVPIHNAVNEMAWQKILEWERMHETECNQPMLLKFQGKPKDITPKARIRSWFGGKKDARNPMSLSFYLDVRPAPTPAGIWDRLKMSFRKGEFV